MPPFRIYDDDVENEEDWFLSNGDTDFDGNPENIPKCRKFLFRKKVPPASIEIILRKYFPGYK